MSHNTAFESSTLGKGEWHSVRTDVYHLALNKKSLGIMC